MKGNVSLDTLALMAAILYPTCRANAANGITAFRDAAILARDIRDELEDQLRKEGNS